MTSDGTVSLEYILRSSGILQGEYEQFLRSVETIKDSLSAVNVETGEEGVTPGQAFRIQGYLFADRTYSDGTRLTNANGGLYTVQADLDTKLAAQIAAANTLLEESRSLAPGYTSEREGELINLVQTLEEWRRNVQTAGGELTIVQDRTDNLAERFLGIVSELSDMASAGILVEPKLWASLSPEDKRAIADINPGLFEFFDGLSPPNSITPPGVDPNIHSADTYGAATAGSGGGGDGGNNNTGTLTPIPDLPSQVGVFSPYYVNGEQRGQPIYVDNGNPESIARLVNEGLDRNSPTRGGLLINADEYGISLTTAGIRAYRGTDEGLPTQLEPGEPVLRYSYSYIRDNLDDSDVKRLFGEDNEVVDFVKSVRDELKASEEEAKKKEIEDAKLQGRYSTSLVLDENTGEYSGTVMQGPPPSGGELATAPKPGSAEWSKLLNDYNRILNEGPNKEGTDDLTLQAIRVGTNQYGPDYINVYNGSGNGNGNGSSGYVQPPNPLDDENYNLLTARGQFKPGATVSRAKFLGR